MGLMGPWMGLYPVVVTTGGAVLNSEVLAVGLRSRKCIIRSQSETRD